jgi:hypothetical protein
MRWKHKEHKKKWTSFWVRRFALWPTYVTYDGDAYGWGSAWMCTDLFDHLRPGSWVWFEMYDLRKDVWA